MTGALKVSYTGPNVAASGAAADLEADGPHQGPR